MRRTIRFLLWGSIVYILSGFVILPPVIHGVVVWLAPRFLSVPLEIAAVYFNPLTLEASIEGLVLGSHSDPVATFQKLGVNLAWDSVTRGHLHVQSVTLEAPMVNAALDRNGQLNLSGLLKPATRQPDDAAIETGKVANDTLSLTVVIDEIRITNGVFGFTDGQITGHDEQPLSITLSECNLDIRSLGLPTSTADWYLGASIGEQGRMDINGSVLLPQGDVTAAGDVTSVDLTILQPFLDKSTWIRLHRGNLSARLAVTRSRETGVTATGELGVESLQLDDVRTEKPVIGWHALNITGINYSEKDRRFSIGELLLSEPDVRVAIDRNMQLNLSQLMINNETGAAAAAPKDDSTENQPIVVYADKIRIADGRMDFSDYSFQPGFATEVVNLQGNITDISTRGDSDATIAVRGQVDRSAPVRIFGYINPLQPEANTDIKLSFLNVELTTLTPYSGRFAGYTLRKGYMNLDLNYRIQNRQLKALNRLVLQQLQLGDPVDNGDAPRLPLRLAIALLKDRNGKIDLDLPIHGDLDNPEFSYRDAVGRALTNIIVRIAAAPFDALASLVGSDAGKMEKIAFPPGDFRLSPNQQQVLYTLARALNERPELMLKVSGSADRLADWPLLRSRQLETTLKRLWQIQQQSESGKTSVATLEQVLVPANKKPALLRKYGNQLQIADIDDVPDDELRTAVLAAMPFDETAMYQLAQRRARDIKDFLIKQAGIPEARVRLTSPVIREQREQAGGWVNSSMSLDAFQETPD